MDKSEEKIIIKGIQEGSQEIFEKFFREFYSALCAYSNFIVKRNEIAEDIVQELFYKIWKAKEKFNINTSLKSYLFRSIYNNSVDYIRSEKYEVIYKDYNLKHLNSDQIEQPDHDMIEKINKAIDELPGKCKEVFKLRKLENLSHAEIAEKLGISLKTVETHIRRANISLRKKLKHLSIYQIIYFLIFFL